MRVAVIGANGQLGTDLCRVLAAQSLTVLRLTHGDLDVTRCEQVEDVLGAAKPDVVISTAAFHKVEQCEKDPSTSFAVNAIGPWNLANWCRRADSILVHFSTDYVFDGGRAIPYLEADLARPLNVYGVSKLAGEGMIATTWEKSFVVRTCGLYGLAGSRGRGGNFVETMLKKANENTPIRVVQDQVLGPTFTGDLAEAISCLIQTERYGLYHMTAEGQCSWYEFARKIFELEGLNINIEPVNTSESASPVRRPAYSVLSKRKLKSLSITMPAWQDGLSRYLAARAGKAQFTPY
jgi:dTDP-4-dehydrorhamnose reductase